MDFADLKKSYGLKSYLTKKRLLGLLCGLMLATIVLNVDRKLWMPLELETINSRNISSNINQDKLALDKIVLILFDDKTQFLLRQNGMPIKNFEKKGRDLVKDVIEKLESYSVKSIGINLNFSNPSDIHSDEQLAKTISKYKNIIIADSIYSSPSQSLNRILNSAASIGYGELYADYDKVVHKIKLYDKGYKEAPSFSYALFKVINKDDIHKNLITKNEFYLRYPKSSFDEYSFIDLLEGDISPAQLKDKVAIVGIKLNSKLIRDQLLSPFDKFSLISDSEVQAVALANLLSRSYLFKFSLNDYPGFYVILSMLLGMVFSSMHTFRRIMLGIILFILLITSAQIAYSSFQTILELVPLVFLLFGNLIVGSLIFLHFDLHEQNMHLEEALEMLSKRSKELESSEGQLQNKNIQLSGALTELNKRIGELKEVRKQLSGKSEEERKRIARELHDDSLARITDLRRYIESMINSTGLPLKSRKELGVAIQTLDNVTQEVRRIINALRPSMLDNALGLIPAIENLLDELSSRSSYKIQTKLTTNISKLKMSESDEINLYRIVQEALNNVFKHSNASKVEICFDEQPGQILVLVNDDGIGINTKTNKKGYGLMDMKERAELIGAYIQYINKPGYLGTTLEIAIPLNKVQKIERAVKAVV